MFLIVLFMLVPNAFAQDDTKMAAALGLEWNMNSHKGYAAGAGLGFDFNLSRFFAIGLSVTASHNFTVFTAIEPAAMFRWYFLGKNHTGFFAQADAGAYLYMENEQTIPVFLGGLRTGLRLPLGRSFYIEPYGRAGYPFVFGIGVTAGMRFLPAGKDVNKIAEDQKQ
jgi:hypothetical protein